MPPGPPWSTSSSCAVPSQTPITASTQMTAPAFAIKAGSDPSNWTHIHHLRELKTCHQPIIFDVNVQTSVDDPQTVLTIRACVSTGQETYNTKSLPPIQDNGSRDGNLTIANSCGGKTTKTPVTPQVGGSVSHPGSGTKPNTADVLSATRHLITFMQKGSQCGANIMFAKSASTVVGLYSGAEVAQSSVSTMLSSFRNQAQLGSTAFQVCSTANAALTFGVYAAGFPDLGVVQAAVKSWTNGLCLNGSTPSAGMDMEVLVSTISTNITTPLHGNSTAGVKPRSLQARADCKTQQVKSGDGCADLATRCGISSSDLTKFNSRSDFCSTLKPNQYYCCSAGTLPDMRPKPNADVITLATKWLRETDASAFQTPLASRRLALKRSTRRHGAGQAVRISRPGSSSASAQEVLPCPHWSQTPPAALKCPARRNQLTALPLRI